MAVPEFKFDFSAVQGMTFEEGNETLFRQMEKHYNEHIQPKPYIFGADPAKLGGDKSVDVHASPNTVKIYSTNIVRMKEHEIKEGKSLGLKDGKVLTGVTEKGAEVFDFLKDYDEQDQIVTGESAKYDLGGK